MALEFSCKCGCCKNNVSVWIPERNELLPNKTSFTFICPNCQEQDIYKIGVLAMAILETPPESIICPDQYVEGQIIHIPSE